jgi:ABC-type amino acid transport substrate-binding protein
LLSAVVPVQAGTGEYSIGVIEGTPAVSYMHDYSHLDEVTFLNDEMAIRGLINGEIDFLIADHLVLADITGNFDYNEMSVLGGVGESWKAVPVVRSDSTEDYGNIELLQAVNAAIAEIYQSEEYELLYSTWFTGMSNIEESDYIASLNDGWPTASSGGRLEKILNHDKEFLACTYDQSNGLSSIDTEGKIIGFEIDLAESISKKIAEHYGSEFGFRIIENFEKNDVVNELLNEENCDFGLAGFISGEAITNGLHPGIPYYSGGMVIAASMQSPNVESISSIFEAPEFIEDVDGFDSRLILIALLAFFIVLRLRTNPI